MAWAYLISGVGLLIGAGMGLYAMFNPRWAARLVRLRDDPERPGGFAEFRGTYGGLFFAAHAVALYWLWAFLHGGGDRVVAHITLSGALSVCAALWLGTSVGRIVSIFADKTGGGFNHASVVFEIVLGLTIASALLVQT
jgi:hypothetical protein